MERRWFAWSMSTVVGTMLLACAGPVQVRETVARPRVAPSSASLRTGASVAKPAREAARKSAQASRAPSASKAGSKSDAETAAEAEERAVAVRGIEGTMSSYDVRATLDGRGEDFDRCHEPRRRGRGKIEFRIRILPNGDVSDVNVRRSNVRNRELVGCYSEVIMASRFPPPHGGYADVTWSTKVGRSRPRPGDVFERRVRWDAPSASSEASNRSQRRESRRESRRQRRHARRQRHDG